MSKGINKVILVGNVGRDPELKEFGQGSSVLNISLATTEDYKTKENEKKSVTQWHKLVLFNKLAEVGNKYLKKGTLIYIEGTLRTRKWTDKTGKENYTTEVHVKDLQILSAREKEGKEEYREQESEPAYDDDLPF